MSILRYTASADNTITNAFKDAGESSTRVTGSNTGLADILEIYSVYGRRSSSAGLSSELSRALIKFPVSTIIADRSSGKIPGSGSVNFVLKLYNAKHPFSTPKNFNLLISPISASWEEGNGLDMFTYEDKTEDGEGSNWMMRNGSERAEITKVVFNSSTKSEYGAGSGAKYLIFYNNNQAYNFWFDDGTGDSAPSATGTEIEVDIQSAAASAAGVAGAFKTVVDARSEFSANIVGASVFVTASTAGSTTHSVTSSTTSWGSLTLSVELSGSDATPWKYVGGDYYSTPTRTYNFPVGTEHVNSDVTDIVEEWIAGTKPNHGFGIRFVDSEEAYFSTSTGENEGSVIHNTSGFRGSKYTKKFFARSTEFFYKRPILEAAFDDSKRDDRGKFNISSSLLPGADNLNKIYFYNYYNGTLADIAGNSTVIPTASFYYSSASLPAGSARGFIDITASVRTSMEATRESKGIYYVNIAATSSVVNSTYPYLIDVWSLKGVTAFTGSVFLPKTYKPEVSANPPNYVLSMPNLKKDYRKTDTGRMRLHVRKKGWSPNIYSVAKNTPENLIVVSGSYRILRSIDNYEVVSRNTTATSLSYDVSGNYFDLSMGIFEAGYQYCIKYSFYDGYSNSYSEQPYEFKFRVIN